MSSSIGFQFTLVHLVMAAAFHSAAAQSAGGCTSALISLAPCLNYVSGNSTTPSSTCCSQLAGVVSSQPQCLCQLVNGGGSTLGIAINQTRALELPSACSVTTPSVSRCNNGGNAPSDSPGAGADGNPPASNDNPGTTPAGGVPPSSPSDDDGGSSANTVPTTIGSSDASFVGMKLHVRLFLVLVASFALSSVGL
ncbi:Non-specific lipid transfer protein GPI-anchored 5 [Linum grandiflorum]